MAKQPENKGNKTATTVSLTGDKNKKSDEESVSKASEDNAVDETEESPVVSAKKSHKDLVTITVYEDIEPPPRIGTWDGKHALGIVRMAAKQSYKVPRHVAEVIADAKKGTIIE